MRALLLAAALASALTASPPPQDPDSAAAAAALRDFAAACAREGGRLWGRPLCGPLLLVDPATRRTVANAADTLALFRADGDAFAGTLPATVGLANTAVRWGGARWAMVLRPLPADRFARLQLLAHESFHREQPALALPTASPVSEHLDERDGRLWLRLELRAWAAALRADARSAAARAHVADALRFRARRHARFPGADTLEAALERHEGLAEYTGARFALDATGAPPGRVADDLAAFERRATYVRSFAYATGPALGLTLDRVAPGWRARVRETPDLARAVAAAARVALRAEPESATWARAARYGGPAVAAEEDVRAAARTRRLAELRARLVDGAALVLASEQGVRMSFDPTTMVPLAEHGTVYPTGTFRAAWGTLTVTGGGALVGRDYRTVRVIAPADTSARPLRGDGWTLELAPGWTVRAGGRAGDVEVVRGG